MTCSVLFIQADSNEYGYLSGYLEAAGLSATFSDLQKSRTLIQTAPVDVALIDLTKLKREGLAMMAWLKEKYPAIGVLLINSPSQIDLSIEGMKMGALDDLMVPLDMERLMQRIRQACQVRKKKEAGS